MAATATGGYPVRLICLVALATGILPACKPSGPVKQPIAIKPMCTVLCEVSSTAVTAWNWQIFVAERTDPTVDHGFTPFRPLSNPRGSTDSRLYLPAGTGVPDTYGIREAWLRAPGAHEVYRAQATPAYRAMSTGPDQNGSSWNIWHQVGDGVWYGRSLSFNGSVLDDPETGAATVPQLMPVGYASPLMFACAGGPTADGAERTTLLLEVTNPSGPTFLQDLLNGDAKGYRGPDGLATSNILPMAAGPGDPIRKGIVQCAVVQQGDDAATRELHMIAIQNGALYHSLANNYSPVQTFQSMSRFHTVSSWGNVGAVLGGNLGTITSAAIVAHPSAISVFFVAQLGGVYRLWHTVRFSSDGSWRPVKDVLALSGDAPVGSPTAFTVSAGICPELGAAVWDESTTETLVALRMGVAPPAVGVVRVVTTARQWAPGVNGFYSPMRTIPTGAMGTGFLLRNVSIAARPFRDDATP